MLYRISQQQIQDINVGNGLQDEEEYTDQGSRGDASTIQHLPNMAGYASMTSKQKAAQGARSRMSLKQ
jgi:hypothetical protein